MKLKQVELYLKCAGDLVLGDKVARSSGQITNIEFCPIHEIRIYHDGRVHIIQKTKNGVTLNALDEVWVLNDISPT